MLVSPYWSLEWFLKPNFRAYEGDPHPRNKNNKSWHIIWPNIPGEFQSIRSCDNLSRRRSASDKFLCSQFHISRHRSHRLPMFLQCCFNIYNIWWQRFILSWKMAKVIGNLKPVRLVTRLYIGRILRPYKIPPGSGNKITLSRNIFQNAAKLYSRVGDRIEIINNIQDGAVNFFYLSTDNNTTFSSS